MKELSRRSRPWRLFFTAAWITFCLLLLLVGFLVAGYNSQKMSTGSASLRTALYYRETAAGGELVMESLGEERALAITPALADAAEQAWTMLPPALRVWTLAAAGEREETARLAEYLLEGKEQNSGAG